VTVTSWKFIHEREDMTLIYRGWNQSQQLDEYPNQLHDLSPFKFSTALFQYQHTYPATPNYVTSFFATYNINSNENINQFSHLKNNLVKTIPIVNKFNTPTNFMIYSTPQNWLVMWRFSTLDKFHLSLISS
jgi:hypothetical protein